MGLFPPHPQRRPAIVTGASSGIGDKTARMLADKGFPVVLGARSIDKCTRIAQEIVEAGGEAFAFPLDLGSPGSIDTFVACAVDAVGPIEVMISNAATIWPSKALETPADDFEDLLRVNLVGPHRLAAVLAPGMIQRRRGDLLFVTSDIVRYPRPGMAAYASSKWGLEGYVRILQMELEGTGVRASIVRPGPTRTDMGTDWEQGPTEWVLGEWMRWGLMRHGVLLRPEHMASAIVTAVSADRGAHFIAIDVQPEGLITEAE